MRRVFFALLCSAVSWCATPTSTVAQGDLYFPPLTGNAWETTTPEAVGWCADRLDSLIQFVGQQNSRAFIILKDGRIVAEAYYGNHTANTPWYWASAGKSLTSVLIGLAQQDGLLNLQQPTSEYLGAGWTQCPPDKEALITIRHQLSMATGVDDTVGGTIGENCVEPACFQYLADAGTRWSYHNPPYLKLQDVLETVTGVGKTLHTRNRLGNRIGMTGGWFDYVYYSTARSMARFGLFMLAGGRWADDTIVTDTAYFNAMTRPSQNLNPAYGYLWWLNGQSALMVPGSQLVLPIPLLQSAPPDLYAALGLNDQKIYVVPSQGLVVIRQGDSAGGFNPSLSSFDNQLWERISDLACNPTDTKPTTAYASLLISPNPASDALHLQTAHPIRAVTFFNSAGRVVLRRTYADGATTLTLPTHTLPPGLYVVAVRTTHGWMRQRVVLQ